MVEGDWRIWEGEEGNDDEVAFWDRRWWRYVEGDRLERGTWAMELAAVGGGRWIPGAGAGVEMAWAEPH